ncbi:MAG: transposase [Magnetococcales bacterium]|nr:transposase [Magnetococcales bacterium]
MPDPWHTPRELAGLPGLPGTIRGLSKLAAREGWPRRPHAGRGGGWEYPLSALPEETRAALLVRTLPPAALREAAPAAGSDHFADAGNMVAPVAKNAPMGASSGALMPAATKPVPALAQLKDRQRQKMDARVLILRYVESLAPPQGSLSKAVAEAVEQSRAGLLPEVVARALPLALGETWGAGKPLSARTLLRWHGRMQKHGVVALAPQSRERTAEPEWAARLLRLYRGRSMPTLAEAVKELEKQGVGEVPSYSQARRYLATRVGAIEAVRGRVSAKDLRGMLPFVRRNTAMLAPMAILNGDGHTFNSLVAHPDTGKPFVPEVTDIFDVRTRRWVGFSVGFSESSEVVIDALGMAVRIGGVPAVLQWDRGRGAKNLMMEAPITGLAARIGFEIYHPAPRNSQAGGIVERSHQTTLIAAAKKLPTFIGKRIRDPDLRREMLQKIKEGSVLLPTWQELITLIQEAMLAYNSGHEHRALPRIADPVTGRKRHMTPNEMWEREIAEGWRPLLLDDEQLIHEFHPERICRVRRGEVTFWKMTYFSKDLTEFHQRDVRVRYDIRDGSKVWIYSMDGRFIVTAERDANKRPYLHDNALEAGQERRRKAQIVRLDQKREEIEARSRKTIEVRPLTPEEQAGVTQQLERMGVIEGEPVVIESETLVRPVFSGPLADAEWGKWVLKNWKEAPERDREEFLTRTRQINFRLLIGIEEAELAAIREEWERLKERAG